MAEVKGFIKAFKCSLHSMFSKCRLLFDVLMDYWPKWLSSATAAPVMPGYLLNTTYTGMAARYASKRPLFSKRLRKGDALK